MWITAALILLVPAYLLGTFPSAVLVACSRGVDITSVGSGNPGASNVARTIGLRWGVLVFVLDGVKGAVPAAVGLLADSRPAAYTAAAAAVVGHMFPVTRRFHGGKGVATMGGATAVLHPLVFVVLLVTWLGVRKAFGVASVASIVIAVGLPIGVAAGGSRGWEVLASLGLSLLVMLRHTDNIRRLLSHAELPAEQDEPSDETGSSVRTMSDNDDFNAKVIKEFRANGGKVGDNFEGMPMVLVTHKGAKTGTERTTPLVCSMDGDDVVIIASMGGAPNNPAWYHNMVTNPEVNVELGSESYTAAVSEVTGNDRARLWGNHVAIMPFFDDYQAKTARTIPVLVLERQG